MLILRNFKPAFGLSSPSPFGIKAIALMQLSGLEYENRAGSLRKSPTGKLPLLQDGEKLIPDSSRIQYHLETTYGVNFNEGLEDEQLATARAFQSMCEEHLYWCGMYFRWIENSQLVKEAFFSEIPSLLRGFIFSMILRGVRKNLHAQGMGRHEREYIVKTGCDCIKAISDYLGKKPYFMGDRPSAIDATVYGFLLSITQGAGNSPLKDFSKNFSNLAPYCEHFTKTVMEQS